uniref:Uncharacterized protein n=1 Tax=Streptomyces sp. NBC_01401 TaxID=2903854 RepID=A0AAU3GX73_9ACTN
MNIRFTSTAIAAAAGAVILSVAPAAVAVAPTVGTDAAPAARAAAPLQAEIPVEIKGAVLNFNGTEHTLDLKGEASLTIDAPTAGNLKTQVTGSLSVTAEDSEMGKIVLESTGVGTASFNSVLAPFPAKLELSATATVSVQAPTTAQNGQAAAPLVLHTKNAAQLTGSLNKFPPSGEFLTLQNQVDFAAGDSDDTVGSVTKFPVASSAA